MGQLYDDKSFHTNTDIPTKLTCEDSVIQEVDGPFKRQELELGLDSLFRFLPLDYIASGRNTEILLGDLLYIEKDSSPSFASMKTVFQRTREVIGKKGFEMQMFTLNTTSHKHLSVMQGNHPNVYNEYLQTKIECRHFDKIHIHHVRNLLFISRFIVK